MMNVDVMRKIDRCIGVPLCFLFSLADRFLKSLRRAKSTPPKKILIIQLSEMGSTVLVRPSVRYFKDKFPDTEFFYLIFKEMKESLFFLDEIPQTNILTITSSSLSGLIKSSLEVIVRLQKEKMDAALDLELFSRFSCLLSRLSGAPVRVGFDNFYAEGLYRGSLLTHRVHYNYYNHISLNFFALFKALSADEHDAPLVKEHLAQDEIRQTLLESTEEGKKVLWEKLKRESPDISPRHRLIVLNANASQLLPLRRWPIENYIQLAKKLLDNKDYYIILTGVRSEMPDALAISSAVNNHRCISLAGKSTIQELIDLYNCADVLVSNDSAPPHLASLTSIRIVVLFGPETPRLYAPLSVNRDVVYLGLACSPCVSAFSHRKSACTNNLCLKQISVDDIFQRVQTYLSGKSHAPFE